VVISEAITSQIVDDVYGQTLLHAQETDLSACALRDVNFGVHAASVNNFISTPKIICFTMVLIGQTAPKVPLPLRASTPQCNTIFHGLAHSASQTAS